MFNAIIRITIFIVDKCSCRVGVAGFRLLSVGRRVGKWRRGRGGRRGSGGG